MAYHLTKLGWQDVVLLERKKLTCGTTWHAAGLIAQLRSTQNMTKLAKYSADLYGSLEAETGVATGFKQNGSITVALTEDRKEELYRGAAMARAFGVEVEEISPSEVSNMYPHLNIDDVVGGVYLPKDGQGDPTNIAHALAKGAKQRGALVAENTAVTGITRDPHNDKRVAGLTYVDAEGEPGLLSVDMIVNCAGLDLLHHEK